MFESTNKLLESSTTNILDNDNSIEHKIVSNIFKKYGKRIICREKDGKVIEKNCIHLDKLVM